MSGISSIGSYRSYHDYGKFASGKRIQHAADGPAELGIIQKEESQNRGMKAGERNIGSAQDMLNITDGAMSGIADYLQRIRELALQASNTAVVTDSDRAKMQKEIDQLKEGISDIASQTTYNTKQLIDGSETDFNIATDSNGNSLTVSTGDATLKALGIADFDVRGDFDISSIDKALSMVNSSRSTLGAQSNRLDFAYNISTNTRLNTTAAQSRLEDLDYPKAISELKKKQTLQEYMLYMQHRKQKDEANRMHSMFA